MNRAQRRAEQKKAKHKENRSRKQVLPVQYMEFESFDSIERMFMMLRNGSLLYSQKDGWILMGMNGEMFTIIDALNGWIDYWQTIADKLKINYDGAPLVRISKALQYSKPLTMDEINKAYAVVEQQHIMYRSLDRTVLSDTVYEVKEKIEREDEIKLLLKQKQQTSAGVSL